MNENKEEDKYMLDTNTDYDMKISVATWVMISWIVLFCIAISISVWLGIK